MDFLPSNKLGHGDGFSRLIPRFCEPFEDTMITTLRVENEIKNVLYNIAQVLPVTLADIKIKAENIFLLMKRKKKQVRWKLNEKKKVR